jgi:hypothetical protein
MATPPLVPEGARQCDISVALGVTKVFRRARAAATERSSQTHDSANHGVPLRARSVRLLPAAVRGGEGLAENVARGRIVPNCTDRSPPGRRGWVPNRYPTQERIAIRPYELNPRRRSRCHRRNRTGFQDRRLRPLGRPPAVSVRERRGQHSASDCLASELNPAHARPARPEHARPIRILSGRVPVQAQGRDDPGQKIHRAADRAAVALVFRRVWVVRGSALDAMPGVFEPRCARNGATIVPVRIRSGVRTKSRREGGY